MEAALPREFNWRDSWPRKLLWVLGGILITTFAIFAGGLLATALAHGDTTIIGLGFVTGLVSGPLFTSFARGL